MTDPKIEEQNTALYLTKVFGFDPIEAELLARLYLFATTYKANLSLLVPVLQGIITIQEAGTSGKVIVNTGIDKGHRYFSVEVRQTLSQERTPLDDST